MSSKLCLSHLQHTSLRGDLEMLPCHSVTSVTQGPMLASPHVVLSFSMKLGAGLLTSGIPFGIYDLSLIHI